MPTYRTESDALPVRVSSEVWRITAPNAGPKTLGGTQTYIVGRQCSYIIDPGPVLPKYQDLLVEELLRRRHLCVGILLTHGHPDHAPGATALSRLLDIPILAASNLDTSHFEHVPDFDRLSEGDRLETDGDILRVMATPGHAQDHLGLYLEKSRILFAGDTILGTGSSVVAPPEGNMVDYMATLARFRALDPAIIAPGHGPLILEPNTKIDEYIEHRLTRERQVLAALASEPRTVLELMDQIYTGLDHDLRTLAGASVTAHLEKLEYEGLVRRDGDHFLAQTLH